MDKVATILFSLSETDKEILNVTLRKREIEEQRANLLADLTKSKSQLEELEGRYRDSASRQALEEHRLKDEEKKILERRKQLATIGGVKSAKLMEREIDIAGRVLQNMEQTTIQSMEEIESLQSKVEEMKVINQELESKYGELSQESEKNMQALEKDLSKLDSTREKQLEKIDQRLKNLYRKVNTRYPGNAVAIAKSGACRSCFRALPAQLYNQIISGNMLLQCPGCSRILVYEASDSKK